MDILQRVFDYFINIDMKGIITYGITEYRRNR